MAKASGTIDLKSMKEAHDDAAKTSTNYITDVDNNGISVHPLNNTNDRTVINGSGMEIFKGNASVAVFGDTLRLGQEGKSRQELDYHSLQLIDKEGNTYFHVSDRRNESGVATFAETFIGDGTTKTYSIGYSDSTVVSITINGTSTTAYSKYLAAITFTTAPASGATIVITYTTTSVWTKAYTAGLRANGSEVGGMSFAEGQNTTANGWVSHAEGSSTTARGVASHAEGSNTVASGMMSHAEGFRTNASGGAAHAQGTDTTANGENSLAGGDNSISTGDNSISHGDHTESVGENSLAIGYYTKSGPNQLAIGKWNNYAYGLYQPSETDYLFMVGNGSSESDRKNAFAVTYGNKLVINGNTLTDYIIEQGSNSATGKLEYYRTWASGRKEVFGYSTITCNSMASFGSSGLYHLGTNVVILKTGYFTNRDTWQFMVKSTGGSGYATVWSTFAATDVNTFTLRIVGSAANAGSVVVNYHIIGS